MKLQSHGASEDCPATGELEAFVVGDLSEERVEFVAAHVQGCVLCGATVQGLDDHADPLVERLAGLAVASGGAAEVPQEFIARAQASGRTGPEREVVVDAGRKIARALVQGPYRLGKFELIAELGAGSFGYVFKARDTELDRVVAVKIQRAALAEHDKERARFLREARSAAQLKHPHIVSLYEAGETVEGLAYLVSEYIEGRNLEDRLHEGPLPFDETARVVAKTARGLSAAHARGVIHRDVKPSNITLDRLGEPHVMDFGLAKREVGETTVTPDGAIMGTPAYMSPEIALGKAHNVDARSDVYSLGVVLYELLTGERPFTGIRRMLVLQVIEDEPRPPRRLNDKIPRDLEIICLKAMEKAPARRYASAADLAADLERFLSGEPIKARPLSAPERLWRWCRQNRLAASLFVAVVVGAGFGFWHLSRLSGELIRSSAVESAAQYSEMLEVVNELYSSEVVNRVGHHGVEATADYAQHAGQIPLPATMLNVLLGRISKSETGMKGRHYSEYPFRTSSSELRGPQDGFEWEALRHLKAQPEIPYQRFVDYDGRPSLLYATARRMQPSCVECHNNHPDSTKRDWRVGDVRGVLKIVRPLEHDIRRTRQGLQGSFVLVGAVSVFLLALSGSFVILGGRRRRAISRPGESEEEKST